MRNGRDGATLLGRYLERQKLTREAFARRMGSTGASVSRWVGRRRVPGVVLAQQIERITHGAVPIASWAKVERAAA